MIQRVRFSPRQLDVIRELCKDGADTATLQRRLGFVAQNTVKTHLKAIYRKTGMANRTELVVALFRLDIVPLDENGRLADVGVH